MLGIDIFSHFVEATPTMVREYVLSETMSSKSSDTASPDNEIDENLLNLVIRTMENDPDQELGGAMQIINLLKLLIDPENMLSAINVKIFKILIDFTRLCFIKGEFLF